jgi:cytochrome oxidase Cu insertion factor (SCO1/SenC/PrrC family)
MPADRRLGSLVAAAALWVATAAAHEVSPANADFVPPAPGSYRLERIMPVPEGKVLDTSRRSAALSRYTQGKVTVLSLMYTTCNDATGCPMAFHVLQLIRRDLDKVPAARGRVRLVSLSFDPARDTPEVMRSYGGKHVGAKAAIPWHFLTTGSMRDVRPIVEGLGQDVSVAADPQAAGSGKALSHVLKVFLVDPAGWVREIYSTSFLVPKVVVNDVKTLLLEGGATLDGPR